MDEERWKFVGDRITFQVIPDGAISDWVYALRGKSRGRFEAAIRIVDRMLAAGAGSAGRLSKVRGSEAGLLLLRVTRTGDSPPHLRVFCLRRGNVLWFVHAFEQKSGTLPKSQLRRAERLAREFLEHEEGD
jgi:hypothetical protein